MRALLNVDTKALKHNVAVLSRLCLRVKDSNITPRVFEKSAKKTMPRLSENTTFFCPMIKAEAYGHGAVPIARALKSFGVKKMGVVSVEEALQIKNISKEIYIFGPFDKAEIRVLESHSFIPVVGRWEDLKNLSSVKKNMKKKHTPFHIKFDLGMSRLGFNPSETKALIKYIKAFPGLCLTGVCSHLSEGEKAGLEEPAKPDGRARWKEDLQKPQRDRSIGSADSCAKEGEIALFQKIRREFQNHFSDLQFHLLNSAGWFSLWSYSKWSPELGFRPGISLYGVKPPVPFTDKKAKQKYESIKLKPVSCLKSFIVQSRTVLPGRTVSYGKTWRAKKKSCVAVVSMGYADGLPYSLSGAGAEVLFRGKRVPIVGRICMDFFMIDVTNALNTRPVRKGEDACHSRESGNPDSQTVRRGEEVVIFGSQKKSFIPLEEQAQKAGSPPYELFTRLGKRVHRVFLRATE